MKDMRSIHNAEGWEAVNALLSDPANFSVMPPPHEMLAAENPAPGSSTHATATTRTPEPPLPPIRSIKQLIETPPDPAAILLGERLLCRGGALLMVGPSGVGKSSMSMQQDLCWAVGREAFGILPARSLRILTIQAENDDGDLYEMCKGVADGIQFTEEEWQLVTQNLHYVTEVARSGESFLLMLDRLLTAHPCDIVRIDPLFAFYGAKIEDSEKLSAFLRGGLNPILHKHNVGLILAHHTPKTTARDTSNWTHTDYSYAGAGGAELTNWARAMLVLDATHTPGSFRLIAAKRGARIGWRDTLGQREFIRYYRHSRQDGTLFWEDGDENEVERDTARKKAARKKAASINPIPLIEAAVPLSRPIGRKELEAMVNRQGPGIHATRDALDLLLSAEEPSFFLHREKRPHLRDRIVISRMPPPQYDP
jgi:AAA domain-containing protein